jgi:type VI secretion system protein ImpJ
MATTNALPEAIQWSEGMLLSPQHFQQNDQYWQAHLRHRMQALNPHYWGVLHLQYDLTKEVISFSELECVLPDGLLVQFPGQFPRLPAGDLALDIGADCKIGGAPQRVWLWVNDRSATAACQDSIERRYNSVLAAKTADENTGDGWLSLARLQVAFQLYIGNRSPSADCAVPLLEVVRGPNGQLQVTAYHPPLLKLVGARFQADRSLTQRLHQLHDFLWSKVSQLGGQNDDTGQGDDMGEENRQHLNVARHLAACLPQLSILLHEQCHPAQLYQAVAHVVGQVSCINANPLPLLMKPYQHEDCMPQFQAAFDFIHNALASIDATYETLPFLRADQRDNSGQNACFERRLSSTMRDQLIIELKPRDSQTAAQLLSWLDEAIIASDQVLPHLLRARLSGATVRALTAQEIAQYKMRPQAALFLLQDQPLTLGDDSTGSAFGPDQTLCIQGRKNANLPAAILLHHKKSPAAAAPSNGAGAK